MSVVGYDLGAETCVISVAHRRVINVMQNQTGKRKTPSIVAFQGKVRRFADDALAEYMGNWKNSVRCIKRLIGRSFDDPELKEEQAFLPHKMVKMPNGLIGMQLRYNDEEQVFSAEQIMGALFQELKTIAELGLEGLKVADCVIGVPVWWDDRQRIAIMDAAKIAGLNRTFICIPSSRATRSDVLGVHLYFACCLYSAATHERDCSHCAVVRYVPTIARERCYQNYVHRLRPLEVSQTDLSWIQARVI